VHAPDTSDPGIPLVTIIVPCRNEAAAIEACLSSVILQHAPKEGFEIIVADGMSDDGTREILEEIAAVSSPVVPVGSPSTQADRSPISHLPSSHPNSPAVGVINNPGLIVSMGLNAAIRAARGGIIIRMDAHTEYAPDYVRECVAALRATGADNVGGPARTKAQTFIEKAVAAAYHSPFAVGAARFHDTDYEGYVDTVTYGCWPRSTFEKFGLFDEELVRNQDDEHNLRITRGGGKIYQSPKIRSWYRPRGTLAALFKQYLQYGYWKVRVIQKHKLPASWRHLVPGGFLVTLALFALGSLLFTPARWLFLSLVGVYALCVLVASVVTVAKTEWKLLPVLPLVFGCYHFGYGFGFLRGILDFVILRRGASVSFTKLTRASSETKAAPATPMSTPKTSPPSLKSSR
jgi:succinoglycan biosynthesis protein ExoA